MTAPGASGADGDPFGFDRVDVGRLRARRTVKWSLYGPDVLPAWVAEMDVDVAPVVRAAIRAAVDREDFGYAAADLGELTGACSSFLRERHGWAVPEPRIFPVADVLAGVAGAIDVFVPAGAPVVVPSPAYPPLYEVVELGGRPPVPVPMTAPGPADDGPWALDLDAIDAALGRGARAVLLTNPHNPTGRAFTAAELVALADVVERHGARVVADEVHGPLVHPGHVHVPYASVSDAAGGHAVTVTSASKAFNLAGLRCAQVVTTNHEDAAAWRRLPVFRVPGPTPLGIAASSAAYAEGGEWLDALRRHLDRNRGLLGELLAGALPGIGYRAPEATYLAWLDCSALGLDDPAARFLHDGRVALSDGPPFGPGCEQHVRLNLATSGDLLHAIVDRMAAAVPDRF